MPWICNSHGITTIQRSGILFCLIVIVLWGGVLRFYRLGAQSFWMDEAASVLHAQAIVDHGYPLLGNGRLSTESLPTHYLMALGIMVCPDVHWGGRIMSALVGTLTLPLFFLLSRRLYRNSASALLATALMAFLAYEIAWSRQARMYVFLQLFAVGGILAVCRAFEEGGGKYLLMAGMCSLLAVLTHRAGYLVVLIVGLMMALSGTDRLKEVFSRPGGRAKWLFMGGALAVIILFGLFSMKNTSAMGAVFNDLNQASGRDYSHQYFSFLKHSLGPFFWIAMIGGALFVIGNWRVAVPLVVGGGLFWAVISWKTALFAFRYSFPLFFILILLAGYAFKVGFGVLSLGPRWLRMVLRTGLLVGFGLGLCFTLSPITLMPQSQFLLGYTEPQPDWRKGFSAVAQHHASQYPQDSGFRKLSTITTLPMFHDIYLGKTTGHKYYLPLSFTGHPSDKQRVPAFTEARIINNVEEIKSIDGYVILDDYSLLMLIDQGIQAYMQGLRPMEVISGQYPLYVWRIKPQSRGIRSVGQKIGPYR